MGINSPRAVLKVSLLHTDGIGYKAAPLIPKHFSPHSHCYTVKTEQFAATSELHLPKKPPQSIDVC